MAASAAVEKIESAGSPEVRGGVAPYLAVDGAIRAAELYKKAFGATEIGRHPPAADGRTMHVHLYVNGGSVMLCDPYPEHGYPLQAPQAFTLHLQVDDADSWWNRATAAGLQVEMPLQLMFWGDRYGLLRDQFGVRWSIGATPKT